ncbi:MAG: hypothetical protein HYV24_06510 [Deltaproteobacteria bacterium]|nr:hypothetical protein [Deltaproteobacteria bacterium]
MKKVSSVLALAVMTLFFASSTAKSEININIGIKVPPVIAVKAPPAVVVIPGTYIYFAPDVDDDAFFYRGYWWRTHKGRWYRAAELGDPWIAIGIGKVPRVLLKLPPDYRKVPPGHEKIPYGQLKKHWQVWEKERKWERANDIKEEERGKGKGKGKGR